MFKVILTYLIIVLLVFGVLGLFFYKNSLEEKHSKLSQKDLPSQNQNKITEKINLVGLYYNLDYPEKTFVRDAELFKEVVLEDG